MKIRLISKDLPLSLRIISVIYYIAGFVSIAVSMISFFSHSLIMKIPGFSVPPSALSAAFITLGILLLLFSAFSFFVAKGLQDRNNAARMALTAFSLLNIVGGIISVIEKSYLSSINLAFNIVIVYYLIFNRRVRNVFGKKKIF